MKNKSNKILMQGLIVLIAISTAFVFRFSLAQSPREINVSAYIVNSENKEITNGEYEVRFALYTIDRSVADPYPSASDSRVWEEVQKVKLQDGFLNAYLGAVNPIPASIQFTSGSYYLGIRMGTDSEMVPRKRIGSVPLAVDSFSVNGATVGTGAGNLVQLGAGGKINIKQIPTGTTANSLVLGNDSRLNQQTNLSIAGGYNYLSVSGQRITLNQIDLTTDVSGTLGTNLGGTGLSSYTSGDFLYYNSGNALSQLNIGVAGEVLTVVGGLPAWMPAAGGIGVHDLLSLSHTDVTAAAVQRGDLIFGQGALPTWSRLAMGAPGHVLLAGANEPSWGTVGTAGISDNSINGEKIALGSDEQGDIMYYNGTDWVRLVHGNAGEYLATGGNAANPSWGSPAGAGDVTDVGNCASGACFTAGGASAAAGTSLYFYDAQGKGQLTIADLTGPQTYTLPDASGTLALTSNIISDHGGLSGLADDDHTQYALLLGRAGGQTLIGGTAASNNLTFQTTSNGTKGSYIFSELGSGLVLSTSGTLSAVSNTLHSQNTDTGTDGANFTIGDGTTTFTIDTSATNDSLNIEQGTYDSILSFTQPGAATQTYSFTSGGTVWTSTNDGSASTLDADLLDGHDTAYFQTALGFTPITNALTSAYILVGNSANVATAVAMSGDVTIDNTGATTIGANSVDGTMIALGSDEQGDIMYYNGTDWVRLVHGNAGEYLATGGNAANPSWGSPAGAGDVTDVGNCASGACFTAGGASAAAGTSLYFYDAQGKGQLTIADLTGPQTYTLPDASGTLALTSNIISDHGGLSGLADDDHTQYALLLGRAGGQTLIGGTAASNNLTFQTTSNGTKGSYIFSELGSGLVLSTSGTLSAVSNTLHSQNTDTGTDGANFTIGDGTTTFTIDTSATNDSLNIEQGTYDSILSFTQPGAATQTYSFTSGGTVWTSTNDGSASTLDADLLDGHDTAYFQTALGFTPITNALTSAYILVGNSANVATAVAMSGDVTIDNTGATTIGANSVDGTMIALGSDEQGDIMYYNGTDWVRLVHGNAGEYLATGGNAANPSWGSPAGAGDVTDVGNCASGACFTAGGASAAAGTSLYFYDAQGKGQLTIADLTGPQTYTLPDASGTLALTSNIISDHGGLSGLADDDHTQYALLLGRAGGQTLIGGTAASNNLTFQTTSNGTKGSYIFSELGSGLVLSTSGTLSAVSNTLHSQNTDTGTDGANFTIGDGTTTFTIDTSATNDSLNIEQGTYDSILSFTQPGAATQTYSFTSGGTVWTSTNDGSASTLDADLLDGHDTAYFQTALGFTPITNALTSAYILVGNSANVATAVAMSGDVTIDNTGATTIGANSVDGTMIALGSDEQGDIMYYNGTDWVRLVHGNAGEYLATGGNAANPSWGSPAGAGDVTDVGNCASGACFTAGGASAAAGTSLYFYDAQGKGQLTIADLTGPQTYTLPDASGTLALTSNIISDHGGLSGLADDDHTQYALLLGRAGGQTLIGGTAASNNLTFQTTSNGTKGSYIFSELGSGLVLSTSGTLSAVSNTLHSQNTDTGTDGANFTIGDGTTTFTIDTSATNDSLNIEQGTYDSILSFTQPGAATQTYSFTSGGTVWTSTNDGSASTLDADLLDGHDTAYFQTALGFTPITNALTSAYILVGNSANVATAVAMSGDVTIDNTGATTIGANSVDGTMIALGSDEQGDIMYYNGTDWVRLVHGNAGEYLATGGNAANPSWGSPAGAGDVTDVGNCASGACFTAGGASAAAGTSLYFYDAQGKGQLTIADLTGPQTYTLPDASGTLALTSNIISDHGGLSGLADDDHTQYALLLGRAGGQTLIGGTAASNNLTFQTTSNGTKGSYIFSELGSGLVLSTSGTLSAVSNTLHSQNTDTGTDGANFTIGDGTTTFTIDTSATNDSLNIEQGTYDSILSFTQPGAATQTYSFTSGGTVWTSTNDGSASTLDADLLDGHDTAYFQTALGFTPITNALTSAYILVGNSANVATAVAMSGDVTIDNTGATTIGANSVDGTMIALGSDEQGDIMYYNGTDWVRLVHGNAGEYLATGGNAANPSWGSPAGAGDVTDVGNCASGACFTAGGASAAAGTSLYFYDAQGKGQLTIADLTGPQTYTLPDASGTLALTSNIISDHGGLSGLADDDHTQYALLLGRAGGQTLIGGTAASNNLTFQTTSNGTKGSYIFSELGSGLVLSTSGTLSAVSNTLHSQNTDTGTDGANFTIGDGTTTFTIDTSATNDSLNIEQGTYDSILSFTQPGAATQTYSFTSGGTVWTSTNDGSASTLDADLLDGHDTAYFQTALGFTPITNALTSAYILVGNSANVATAVAMSGDVTIDNTGATTIGANSVDGTMIALGSDEQGDIMYYNGTDWVRLVHGNAGEYLATGGNAANPSWGSPAGAGDVTDVGNCASGACFTAGGASAAAGTSLYFYDAQGKGQLTIADLTGPQTYTLPDASGTLALTSNIISDHGGLSGLADDDHTQYALLLGRAGGQTLIGGTAASNNLTFQTTSNGTKGSYIFSELGSGLVLSTSGTLSAVSNTLHSQNTDTGTDGANFTIGDGTTTFTIDTSATNDSLNIEQGTYDSILSFTQPGAATQTYSFTSGGTVWTSTNDGSASTLDADLLDGHDTAYFQTALGFTPITNALTSAYILVGNSANVATAVAMSGDVTIDNTGATTIGANSVDGTMIALGSDEQGDIMYYNGTDWVRLVHGNAGEYLATGGNAANPSWGSPAGAGDVTDVGNCASGACFTAGGASAAAGTSLYFYDAQGKGQLTIADLTGPQTYTLPDASGTLALTSNIISDHGGLSGLADDDHTQYALLLGRAGGQTLIGGTAASNNLTFQTTSNGTKGSYIFSELGSGLVLSTSGTLSAVSNTLHSQNTDTGTDGANFTIGDGTTTFTIDTSATNDSLNIEQGTYDSILSFTQPGAATQTYSFTSGGTVWTSTNDGSASTLDADLLDGHDTAYFQTALGFTPITNALTSAYILVGNSANVATAVAMSGDVTIDNTGATTIGANSVDGTMIALGSDEQGDIMYYNGTDWVRLVHGNAGEYLATGGNAANPSWGSPAGAGDVTDVGNCASGACFTAGGASAAAGTSLYFYDAQGKGQLTIADLTGPQTYTLPDASGTLALTSNIISDHGGLSGLADDDHTQYALLLGRAGGQTLIGGTAASNNLTFQTTSNGTKGSYIFSELGSGLVLSTSGTLSAVSNTLHSQNTDTGTDGANFTIGDGTTTFTIDTSATNDSLNIEQGTYDSILSFTQPGAATQTYSFTSGGTVWTSTNDGSASTLDADLLDGHDTAYFQTALGFTPITNALTSAYILVGNSANVATAVAMSGDVTIDNTGATTIGANSVDGTMIALGSDEQGDIMYYNGTDWVRLVHGNAGEYLATGGNAANPSWGSPAGAGDVTDVGNCASGACFTAGGASAAAGTSLYFYDAQGKGQLTIADLTGPQTYTLPDASGTLALTSNNLSIFAATTSAQLAGVISDEVGTDKLVFNTTPTFITNITAPLIIGGTGATDDLILRTTSGTGASGADMIFQTGTSGGTEAMRILYDGKIGIGVTAPAQTLTLNGTFGILDADDSNVTIFQGGAQTADITYTLPTGAPGTTGYVLSGTTAGVLSWAAQNAASLWTDGGAITYLTATGDDVAMGGSTSSSPFYLDVDANSLRLGSGATASAVLNMYASNAATGSITYTAADAWDFEGGNVGIGVTAPAQTLTLNGTFGILDADDSNATIFQGGAQTADITYTLPTGAPGGAGYVLSGTTAGVLSWAADVGFANPMSAIGDMIYGGTSGVPTRLAANANSGLALVSGGAGAPTWFAPTQGSLIFAGANGALTQDNANFFWNDSDNRLGIGTSAPATQMEIYSATASPIFTLTAADNSAFDPQIQFRTDGTPTVKFSMGVDAGDGDKFKIYSGSGIGDTSEFTIDSNGVTSIANLEMGAQSFEIDAGAVTWIDLPVVSAADNTVESYTAMLDGNAMLTIYGLATGSGGVDNLGVGIGTTAPAQTLTLNGTLGILDSDDSNATIFQGGAQTADITYTLPTGAPGGAGYVLSGTTAGVLSWAALPTGTLFTDGGAITYLTSNTDDFAVGATNSLTAPFSVDVSNSIARIGLGSGSYNGVLNIYSSNNHYLQLTHDGTNAAITADTGNINLGTSGDLTLGANVNIVGEGNFEIKGDATARTITLGDTGKANDDVVVIDASNLSISSGGTITDLQTYSDTVGVTNRDLFVDSTGKIGYVSSSIRYKQNVVDMEDISWLYQLRPVNYTYKTDGTDKEQYGLIAEEVDQINPLFVSYDAKGNPETVSYSMFAPVFIKALQEQKNEISDSQLVISNVEKNLGDQNISVSDKLKTVGSGLADLDTQIADYQLQITELNSLLATLQAQIDELKQITNQDLNVAQIEASKNDIELMKLVLGLDRVENTGDVQLLGKLEADGVVAGAFTVKVANEEKKTIGKEKIWKVDKDENGDGIDDDYGSDGKKVFVKTKAVSDGSRIFVTPKVAISEALAVTGTEAGSGFWVSLKSPVSEDIEFDWFLVEEKSPSAAETIPEPGSAASSAPATVPAIPAGTIDPTVQ